MTNGLLLPPFHTGTLVDRGIGHKNSATKKILLTLHSGDRFFIFRPIYQYSGAVIHKLELRRSSISEMKRTLFFRGGGSLPSPCFWPAGSACVTNNSTVTNKRDYKVDPP
eukprot:scaffold175436_cov21-Cyclotella_meneghiniana.AAC.1